MRLLAGIDIGGTKCAVSLGEASSEGIRLMGKRKFPTPPTPQETIVELIEGLDDLLAECGGGMPEAIGISCGGPLNSRTGYILSPPNLPGWDEVDVVSPFQNKYQVPTVLQNDANACALAEWHWGAGKNCSNAVFLTFGTGMGAGLILDGRLYVGASDMAGEVGHIRLEKDGPVGYGKAGSFEGFCSGGGIARLAQGMAHEQLEAGKPPLFYESLVSLPLVTAQDVAEAAHRGDALALEVFDLVARQLGRGLALLIDILNPECIIIGSIYSRQEELLRAIVMETLEKEALPLSLSACRIVPAGLGEQVGDFAALSAAYYTLK